MIDQLIWILIYAGIIALFIVLVLHFLGVFNVPLPAQAVQIIWGVFALIVLLLIVRLLLGMASFPALE